MVQRIYKVLQINSWCREYTKCYKLTQVIMQCVCQLASAMNDTVVLKVDKQTHTHTHTNENTLTERQKLQCNV